MAFSLKSFIVVELILVILCYMAFEAEAGRCPRNVKREARRCMRHIRATHQRHSTPLDNLMSVMKETKEMCRDGKMQNAFACLNSLYSSCAKSREGMGRLEMIVDVGKWKKVVENVCNSVEHFENYGECEAKAMPEFAPCAQQAKVKFERQLRFLETHSSVAMTSTVELNKARVDVGCSFTTDILTCLQEPFEKHCPGQMAVLLRDTFQEFIPPACAKRAMQRSISTHSKYDVDEPEQETDDWSKNDRGPDVVEIVEKEDGERNAENRNDNDDESNKKTSYDEEYSYVKSEREGTVGAARSEKDGADAFAGNLILITAFVVVPRFFNL